MSSEGIHELKYSIHQCSSYSAVYLPENILVDRPNDQSSRWSSETNHPPQYLILRLEKPAIVTEITFGKYEKTHVCNVRKFKIEGGMTEKTTIEILDSGLKNDNHAETFSLKHKIRGNCFPCRYIKIIPTQSWGPSFNFSIWYVQLKGDDSQSKVKEALTWLKSCREKEAIRLCLKHFRQHNYTEAFESLQKRTKVQLEDELLTELHRLLVVDGDFSSAEKFLEEAAEKQLFNDYIRKQVYTPKWNSLSPQAKAPGMRGGHQMCIDPYSEAIYLFGGWDGSKDLADLWCYNTKLGVWNCISADTSLEGGPSARSCHKMCLDTQRKKIFILGRYLESNARSSNNIKSDFYVYDTEANKWQLITDDTAAMGGPQLIFDHQMCMDVEKNTLFVFGGRILSATPEDTTMISPSYMDIYSGLYAYHVPTNAWRKLRNDYLTNSSDSSTAKNSVGIKSRIGHSMLFHEKLRLLYIFAGQRHREYLSDFFTYNVDTDEINVICDGEKSEVPAAGFTQRATLDINLNEVHVLSGINKDKDKDKDKRDDSVKNSFWVYDILQDRWSCVYKNDNICNSVSDKLEPCPRFAHQLVYDHVKRVHYLFGGNPGRNNMKKPRLDDFWTLKLSRLTLEDILRRCRKVIREQCFKEIISDDPINAVKYLQSELYEIYDHNDTEEAKMFQLLASFIFKNENEMSDELKDYDTNSRYTSRSKMFDTIVEYFPEEITQPKSNLVDLILL